MTLVLLFTVIWWVVFFMILPIGINISENHQAGHADSAPDKSRLLIKTVVTTILSLCLTPIANKYWPLLVQYVLTAGH